MLRDHPELATEQAVTAFALKQVRAEQLRWRTTDVQRTGDPGSTVFVWQESLDKDPEFALGTLLDTFMRQDADWSFVRRDPRWAEVTGARADVFMFSRKLVDGRSEDFAARDVVPILKRHLEMAISRAPNELYITAALPRFAYDFDAQAIRFLAPNSAMVNGRYTFAEKINILMSLQGAQFAPPVPATAQSNANYFFASAPEPPSTQPGNPSGSTTAAWRSAFTFGSSDTTFPTSSLVLSFDRDLALRSFALDPARAEQLVKTDAIMTQGGGGLRARVYFHADRVDVAQRPAAAGRPSLGFGVLFARLSKVEILGKDNSIIVSLPATGFASGAQGAAAPTPAPTRNTAGSTSATDARKAAAEADQARRAAQQERIRAMTEESRKKTEQDAQRTAAARQKVQACLDRAKKVNPQTSSAANQQAFTACMAEKP
jgi:hypothetical protein